MRLLFSYGFLLMLFGNAAVGCVCLPIPQTPCEEAKNAVVFRGRLVEANPIVDAPMPGLPPPPPTGMRYRFEVLEDFSGAARTSVELVRTGMTSCDATYSVGGEYIVYARKGASGQLQPQYKCSRTRPIENADLDLQYFRRPASVRTVLAGTLRTRTGFVAGERIVATTPFASFETKTNTEGLFQFLDLPPGKYILHVAHHPDLQRLNAEVNEGGCSSANFGY
jgi:hypothetical protein